MHLGEAEIEFSKLGELRLADQLSRRASWN